jgi:MFS family permease
MDAAEPGTKTRDMLRHPIFWLMFAMMTMMSTSGLMVTSQLGNIASEVGVAKMSFLGFAVLPSALFIDRLTNGLTRPFFGWVSDQIGREPTMALAFTLEGVAMALWFNSIGNPMLFVLLSGVVFFGWGEIFSLFPATLTDTFGPKDATLKYGWLYIAQGVGSVLGAPLASLLHARVGWGPVFWIAIGADLLTATLAMVALRPMRRAYAARIARA